MNTNCLLFLWLFILCISLVHFCYWSVHNTE